jgi:hypothetical protein
MDSQLDKILNIIRRTGEKVIVFKDDSEFVISSLDNYSHLIEGSAPLSQLSEGEMLDKINRDIALWRESQKELQNKEQELDFLDKPQTPCYDSSDILAQDRLDDLSDEIFAPREKETPREREQVDKQPDWNEQAELLPEDFDEFEDYDLDNFEQPDAFDLEQDKETNEKQEEFDDDWQDFYPDEDVQADKDFNPAREPEAPESKVNINNFGYANPDDTETENNNLEEDSWLKSDENTEEIDDFDDIPPPPDINKK